MLSGALIGIGLFVGCIAATIYYFTDRHDD
jgi:hypothetical protein